MPRDIQRFRIVIGFVEASPFCYGPPKRCSRKIIALTVFIEKKRLVIETKYRYHVSRERYSMYLNQRGVLCRATVVAKERVKELSSRENEVFV